MSTAPPADDPERPRVSLRPLAVADAERMVAWMGRDDVRDDVGVRREPSLEFTLSWIEGAEADSSRCARAILMGDEHVGNVVLDRIDADAGLARLSIYIGDESTRGHGVGGRAVRMMLEHAFGALALRKVYLTVHAENTRAIRAYERAGFVREGRHRAEFDLRGHWVDLLYFGVLREEIDRRD